MADIPDEIYDFLESLDTAFPLVHRLLAKYPRSQPEPAWQPGDVVLDHGRPYVTTGGGVRFSADAELIARDGRRVHPTRFADHARWLRRVADNIQFATNVSATADEMRRIAADLAGDNDA